MKNYSIKKTISKIGLGTKNFQKDMGKVLSDNNIDKFSSIINDSRTKLQDILSDILYYQSDFINMINTIQLETNSQLDLSKMFLPNKKDQEKLLGVGIDTTALNLKSLFDDDVNIALDAARGLVSYMMFKEAAVDAFTANLELQNQIHQNTNFYDIFAISTKDKTDLYMLDSKALNSFLKTNFVDFVPEGIKDKNKIITGTISDFRLNLNNTIATRDPISTYFENKIAEANSGVYKLNTSIAEQIFNADFKKYIEKSDFINNPSFGNKIEPVINSLLQGEEITAKSYEKFYKEVNNPQPNKKGVMSSYKFEIPSSTFGGAQGDSIGGKLFYGRQQNKEGKYENIFSFSNYENKGLTEVNANVQIKGFNYTQGNKTRLSWGYLSDIFQNTAVFTSESWFNRTKSTYQRLTEETNEQIARDRQAKAESTASDLHTTITDFLAEALGYEIDDPNREILAEAVSDWMSNSDEVQTAVNDNTIEQ